MAETSQYSEIINAFALVIEEAAKTPLGIVALMILLLSILAFFFFRKEKVQVKLIVFSSLLIGFVLFGYKTYNVEAYRITEDHENNGSPEPSDVAAKKPKPKSSIVAKTRTSKTTAQVKIGQSTGKLPQKRAEALAMSTSTKSKRPDCKDQWTGWLPVGRKIPDPCRDGCKQAKELGRSYRVAGFPPKPQIKYQFQCSRR